MTKNLALSGIAHRMFFGLAILVMASQAAMADPATLICNLDTANAWKEDEPSTIGLNEAQNSVIAHWGARTLSVNGSRAPAQTSGPLPATFATDSISFIDSSLGHHYTLNRLTGILLERELNWKWACQAGKKRF